MLLLHVADLRKKYLHSENKKGVARSFSDFGGPLRVTPDTSSQCLLNVQGKRWCHHLARTPVSLLFVDDIRGANF